MQIEAREDSHSVDGLSYHFQRGQIAYMVTVDEYGYVVWRNHVNKRNWAGGLSNTLYQNGKDHNGKPMPKFMKKAIEFIEAG